LKQVKEVIVRRVPSPSEEPWWSQTPQGTAEEEELEGTGTRQTGKLLVEMCDCAK